MKAWKNHFVVLTIALLSISFPVFFLTGYTALYWAWIRGNLPAALPLLPWARNFGALAISGAAVALVVLFCSRAFPVSPRTRLWLSLLVTATIAFFAEFRNEGKFHFKALVHFFGPGTWIHEALSRTAPSTSSFLYRVEYSHWNDFLMGPAIVSVLFSLVFIKVYGAYQNQSPMLLSTSTPVSTDVDDSLRFARILMNVGLFWFFIQAWAEKAGYLRSPHSSDAIDLPFEFAGTMLGFWMVRVLTKPLDGRAEKFRSTFLIDFAASGVFGILYTLVVGPLTEGVASAVGHSLSPAVPSMLDVHEYTPLQQHLRPFELLLLAGALWWGLNHFSKREEFTRLEAHPQVPEDTEVGTEAYEFEFKPALVTLAKALGITTGYLLILAIMLSLLEPEGLGWTVVTVGVATGATTMALLLAARAARRRFLSVLNKNP